MRKAEAHLAFLKCWLIISRADTLLFIPQGSRTLYTEVDFFQSADCFEDYSYFTSNKNILEKGFLGGQEEDLLFKPNRINFTEPKIEAFVFRIINPSEPY